MAKILIVYGTTEGHTAKIARHIAQLATGRGHAVEVVDGRRAPQGIAPGAFDAVMVGASIHFGAHPRCVRAFVRAHRPLLEQLPSAFFSVSLAARGPRERQLREARDNVRKFLRQTGWQPGRTAMFAGALCYSRYSPVKRPVMRLFMKLAGGDTDPSRDYEYTDWDAVTRFAEAFLDTLA